MRQRQSLYPSAASRADSAKTPIFGSTALQNNVAGSDIRVDWATSIMVPRFDHTIIWKVLHFQQSGYYTGPWHVYSDNAWHGGPWEYGTGLYPCDGSFDSNGLALGGTGGSGTIHYHEIADGLDYIASPGGIALLGVKGVWIASARQCVQVGGNYVHTYYPDIFGHPDFSIVRTRPTSDFTGSPSMKLSWFSSPWTGNGSSNSETQGGTVRHWLQYANGAMTFDAIEEKAARGSDDTSDPYIWYSNLNPTPTDVSDKSGQGRHPTFANANRPTLWTG